jgi:hypothetical protein
LIDATFVVSPIYLLTEFLCLTVHLEPRGGRYAGYKVDDGANEKQKYPNTNQPVSNLSAPHGFLTNFRTF